MKLLDNITKIARYDMADTITKHSKVSVASACFSMYAYNELKKQLEELGKTFSALAVIKYYENRNKSVLVLCPKKLAENWKI